MHSTEPRPERSQVGSANNTTKHRRWHAWCPGATSRSSSVLQLQSKNSNLYRAEVCQGLQDSTGSRGCSSATQKERKRQQSETRQRRLRTANALLSCKATANQGSHTNNTVQHTSIVVHCVQSTGRPVKDATWVGPNPPSLTS